MIDASESVDGALVRIMERRRRGVLAAFRVADWPLAAKVIALCVGLSAVLTIGLTVMGYRQAAEGAREQAETALRVDAQMVAGALDTWNGQRLTDLQTLATFPAVRGYMESLLAGTTPKPEDLNGARDALVSFDSVLKDVDSVTLTGKGGKFDLSSVEKEKGTDVSFREYYNVPFKEGKNFITGVSISTTTKKPAIFHSVPVKNADGKIVGVARSRATLEYVGQSVAADRDRAGAGSVGVLLDQTGLVLASVDPSWESRPIVALKKDTLDALVKEKRWGDGAVPEPLGQPDLVRAVGIKAPTFFDWARDGVKYRAVAIPLAQTDWVYVSALPMSTFQASANDFLRNGAISAAIAMLLASLLAVLFSRPLSQSSKRVVEAARRLAQGELDHEVKVTSRDEFGQVAQAFREVVESQRVLAEVAQAVAEGDLTRQVAPRSEKDLLGRAFAGMIGNLRVLVGQVKGSAEDLAESSGQLGSTASQTGTAVQQVTVTIQSVAAGAGQQAEAAQDTHRSVAELVQAISQVSSGAHQQAKTVEGASATTGRMVSEVEQVASNADRVARASQESREVAVRGSEMVRESVAGMMRLKETVDRSAAQIESLGAASEQIGVVVDTIDDIAEQTNLLALNAAIEAARAGEHGRGFAVVADEVRKLAERSSRETRQIAELVRNVQASARLAVEAMRAGAREAEAGTELAGRAGEALGQIVESAEQTVGQVKEIASGAQGMALSSREVSQAMESVAAMIEEARTGAEQMEALAKSVTGAVESIAATAEENSAATEEMSASAQEMGAQVEEVVASAESLSAMAEKLKEAVASFRVAEDAAEEGVMLRRRQSDWVPQPGTARSGRQPWAM